MQRCVWRDVFSGVVHQRHFFCYCAQVFHQFLFVIKCNQSVRASDCFRSNGHTDTHLSAYGSKWTDESDRKSAIAIANSMKGRTE